VPPACCKTAAPAFGVTVNDCAAPGTTFCGAAGEMVSRPSPVVVTVFAIRIAVKMTVQSAVIFPMK
jgi:hypothetical protein